MKIIKQSAHIVTDWPKMNLYERCEFAGRISHASEDKIKEGSAEEFVRRMVKLGHESVFEFARVIYNYYGMKYPVNLRKLREIANSTVHPRDVFYGCIHNLSKHYPGFFEGLLKFVSDSNDKWELDNTWIPVLITTNRAISHQLVRYRKDVVYLQQSQRYVKFHDHIDFISPEVYFKKESRGWEIWEFAMKQAENEYCNLIDLLGHSAQAARLVLPNSTATKLIMYASPDTWRHVFEQRISDKADPMIRELLEPLKEEFVKEGLL